MPGSLSPTTARRLRWLAAGEWLTRPRAIVFGGVLGAAELALFAFLVAGTNGLITPLEQPVSTDFVSFYAAGALARAGTPELAYDQAAHFAAEQHATEPGIPYQYFFYPPVFLLLCRALVALPYLPAFLVFQAATLALFLLSVRAILQERGFVWAIPVLAAPAAFWTMGLGQNAFLTAALFGGATVLIERRPVIAGCLFGALCYKPHLALLVPVALAAGGHWRAFAAAAGAAMALALASLLLFGWQTWHDYLLTFAGSPALFAAGKAAKLSGLVTPFGAARLLGATDVTARILQAGAALVAAALVGWIWRRNVSLPVRSAALLAGTLIAAPVVLLYDLLLSVVAIAWLVRAGRDSGFLAGEKTVLAVAFLIPLYQIQISQAAHLSPAPLATASVLALCAIRARRESGQRAPGHASPARGFAPRRADAVSRRTWQGSDELMAGLLFWRGPRIGVIELHGVLSAREGALNLESVGPAVERAFRGLGKRGGDVVLDINSPGGSPVQSELIGTLIRRRAEDAKARVHAVIQDVGASGGYWLACAADQILASGLSIVGSVGVIGGGFGVYDLMQRIGIERRLYTAGANKARLDPFSPERPEDVEFTKRLLADIHERFKEWVRSRRDGRLKADDAAVFDGSFMLGSRALELGLIDRFGDLDTLVRELGGPKARPRVFRPLRRRGLLGRLPRLSAEHLIDATLDAIEARQFRLRF